MATSELSSTTAASSGARLPAFTALAIAVAVLLIVTHGVSFLAAVLPPPRGAILDFFKEWASARNRLAGVPVYAPQIDSLRRHLGMDLANPEGFFDAYNTHPPLSVVLALPIAGLNAHFAWKWISLGCLFAAVMLILRESSSTPDASDEERAAHGSMPWLILGLAGILVCDPLLQTLIQGQPTLVIGLLLVLAWRADRHGQSLQSGLWCGLATLIKLYPGLLLVHFLVRRDGRGVLGFVAGIAAGTAISVLAGACRLCPDGAARGSGSAEQLGECLGSGVLGSHFRSANRIDPDVAGSSRLGTGDGVDLGRGDHWLEPVANVERSP
jgi:hypothetical protein